MHVLASASVCILPPIPLSPFFSPHAPSAYIFSPYVLRPFLFLSLSLPPYFFSTLRGYLYSLPFIFYKRDDRGTLYYDSDSTHSADDGDNSKVEKEDGDGER